MVHNPWVYFTLFGVVMDAISAHEEFFDKVERFGNSTVCQLDLTPLETTTNKTTNSKVYAKPGNYGLVENFNFVSLYS